MSMYVYVCTCMSVPIMLQHLYFVNRNLLPVIQLYVSIDASTKESLKKTDRPLFRDFWPRFPNSLDELSEKKR